MVPPQRIPVFLPGTQTAFGALPRSHETEALLRDTVFSKHEPVAQYLADLVEDLKELHASQSDAYRIRIAPPACLGTDPEMLKQIILAACMLIEASKNIREHRLVVFQLSLVTLHCHL